MLLVEFDPESQWLAVASTVAARFCEAGHNVGYLAMSRTPARVRHNLMELGVDVPHAEKAGLLAIEDWYSASLTGGRIDRSGRSTRIFESTGTGLRLLSLKVADLSVEWLKSSKEGPQPLYDVVDFWPPGSLIIVESFSTLLRFNEERAFVEWMESRVNPSERERRSITMQGFVRGIHSDKLYKHMEDASDGVIDIKVVERDEETKNLMRVRGLKGQPHDTRWHEIAIKSSGEVTLAD
jgi:KaiC/GvpD/RAD55 family RecA-like ATPase